MWSRRSTSQASTTSMPSTEAGAVRVVIAGAGPAGLLAAHLLLDRGSKYNVTLIERGVNMARETLVTNRSWVIGLSAHGLAALKSVPGLQERMKVMGIQGKGVQIHLGKRVIQQAQADPEDNVQGFFVDRNWICATQLEHLLDCYGDSPRLKTEFNTRVLAVDAASRTVLTKAQDGTEKRFEYDLLLGCDGVRSVVRDAFMRKYDFECQVQDNFARMKHLHVAIPKNMCNASFHIILQCFGGGFAGVALPELDKDKQPTRMNLILGTYAHQQEDLPKVLFSKDVAAVADFLKTGGGTGIGLGHLDFDFDELATQWVEQDWSRHACCRCSYYDLPKERILLLGDAAHATAPNLGQGLNTALADARVFNELLTLHLEDLDVVLPAFSRMRVKEGQALTTLSATQFCMNSGQQMRLIFKDLIARATGGTVAMNEVPLGVPMSQVYDEVLPRTEAVRQTNEKVIRSFFERKVGMVRPRPGKRYLASEACGCGIMAWGALALSAKFLAAGAIWVCAARASRSEPVEPMLPEDRAVKETGLKLPGIVKAITKLPVSVKRKLLLQPPTEALPDVRDVRGASAHEFIEVVAEKVYLVKYTYQASSMVAQLAFMKAPQVTKELLESGDLTAEQEALAKQDLEKCQCCSKMTKAEVAKGGWLKENMEMFNSMIVLSTANGGLLLYSPVKIDDECKAWLDARGRVDFIVAPSGGHTNFVQSAQKAYPSAKVIANDVAAGKLAPIDVRVDILYDGPAANIPALEEALSNDFEVMPMQADPFGELTLLHKATGTLCVCDLLYSGQLGSPLPPEYETDPKQWLGRLFRKCNFHPGFAGGILPVYRRQVLDPNSGFPMASPPDPRAKELFGASVMKLLTLPGLERLCGAHLDKVVEKDLAKKLLSTSWCWMCEESITALPPQKKGDRKQNGESNVSTNGKA